MNELKATSWRTLRPELYPRRGLSAWRGYLILLLSLALFILGLIELDVTVERLLKGFSKLADVFGLMVPP